MARLTFLSFFGRPHRRKMLALPNVAGSLLATWSCLRVSAGSNIRARRLLIVLPPIPSVSRNTGSRHLSAGDRPPCFQIRRFPSFVPIATNLRDQHSAKGNATRSANVRYAERNILRAGRWHRYFCKNAGLGSSMTTA